MELTAENYYGMEANKAYMSVSQFKDFNGTYGKMACEFEAMEKLEERWKPEPSTALLVGSYVDSYIEGTLDDFKKRNPEIFTQKGELKAPYKKAEEIIARIERDEYFMKYLSGEKQRIMTGNLFGCDWKIKMDSYIPGVAIVDLKVMASITDLKWVNSSSEEAKRRYRELHAMYIDDEAHDVKEIAEMENISEKIVYRDIGIACKILAVYLLGM